MALEATTLKDDEEWCIERFGCIHCRLLSLRDSREHIGNNPLYCLRLVLGVQGDGHGTQTTLTQGDELTKLASIFVGVTLRTEFCHRLRLLDAVDDDLRTFTSFSIELTHVLQQCGVVILGHLERLEVSHRTDGINLAELVS